MSRVTCEPPARPSSDSSPLSDTSTLCKYSPRVIGLEKGRGLLHVDPRAGVRGGHQRRDHPDA